MGGVEQLLQRSRLRQIFTQQERRQYLLDHFHVPDSALIKGRENRVNVRFHHVLPRTLDNVGLGVFPCVVERHDDGQDRPRRCRVDADHVFVRPETLLRHRLECTKGHQSRCAPAREDQVLDFRRCRRPFSLWLRSQYIRIYVIGHLCLLECRRPVSLYFFLSYDKKEKTISRANVLLLVRR